MDNINGIPIIWDEEADKKLLGELFPAGLPLAPKPAGYGGKETVEKPFKDNPFGEDSIFNETSNGFVEDVNFSKLIPAIKSHRETPLAYYYKNYEGFARLPILHRPMVIPDANDKVKDLIKETTGIDVQQLPSNGNKMDIPYTDKASDERIVLDGRLHTSPGNIIFSKEYLRFRFMLDTNKKIVKFTDMFLYTDFATRKEANKIAIIIDASSYDQYLKLCNVEGLFLTTALKQIISNEFIAGFKRIKDDTEKLVWLFWVMPDFVLEKLDSPQLISSLATVLTTDLREMNERIVLKILNAFTNRGKKEIDLLLETITNRKIGKKTLMEVLYSNMNDFGGPDNFTAFILTTYKLWHFSSFSNKDNALYKYNGQPENIPYQSKKILCFYKSGFSFLFSEGKVDAYKREIIVSASPEGMDDSKDVLYASYHPLQPLTLPSVPQEGETKMPSTNIPAFYLKAFDDKNVWANFETTAWLTADIAFTFIGAGNLLNLRHLVGLSKLGRTISILANGAQVLSSAVNTIITLSGSKSKLAEKLRTYLFWLDIATFSVDAITQQMLRKTAKEALDVMDDKVEKEVKEHLEQAEREGLFSTLGGKPIDPVLLKKIIQSFERQGGEIRIGGDVQKFLDARKAEGITYNAKFILLDEKASTSAVYEELIHSAQFRTGKHDAWAAQYSLQVAELLAEEEAARRLIQNATFWKIPEDEISLVKERLTYFEEQLKKIKL